MLKIHILYEYSEDLKPHGSGHIRLLRPLTHPANEGAFKVSWGLKYKKADVLIVERTWQPGMTLIRAEEVVKRARNDRACLIYSIDDNLLDLQVEGPIRQGFTPEEMMVVRYFAREADGIIVSTEALRDRMARFNKNVVVVSNALDERLLEKEESNPGPATPANGRRVIGYMGTYTHDGDLMMILQALRETLRRRQDSLELQLVSGIADSAVIQAFNGLPVRVLDVGNSVEYPAFVRWMAENVRWDLAIAPLEENSFTLCKSDIKFLDYSVLGIAGIYSRIRPYESTVRHLQTGYLANNDSASWVKAFECLLSDDSLRKNIAQQAREYVFSNRILKCCAQNWRDAILAILKQQKSYPTTHSLC
jgi:processive 1,2-diacylglycerol beta-glucosyltransferase